MRRNLALTALACATLAACGTPQEQCIRANTGEYRVVSNLLAEVEGNLARGYAWAEREITTTVWRDCPMVLRDKEGNPRMASHPCLRDVTDVERYRVPIDPAAEQRKRDNLRARLAALTPAAQTAVRACKSAHPERT